MSFPWKRRKERLIREVKRKDTRDAINKAIVDRTNRGKLGRDELIDISLVIEETLQRFPPIHSDKDA